MRTQLVRPVCLRAAEGPEAGRKVTWLELFFDLAFVAAVSQVGGSLTEHASIEGVLRYALLLFLIWWAWLGHTMYSTRFDTDDTLQRVLTLAQIFGVAVMAINADDALDSRSSAGFAAAYGAIRLILVGEYLRARRVPRARALATWTATGTTLTAVAWIASSIAPMPLRFALWGGALAGELAVPLATARSTADAPPDAAHLPERFGLFTIILFGESLVSVMRGMKTQETWSVEAATSALFGMAVAFSLWWWYFDGVDGAGEFHVRSPRDAWSFHAWSYAHLPLYLGIGVAGFGAEHVIRIAPTQHLPPPETWMLGGGLATAMMAITTIAATRPRSRPWRTRVVVVPHAVLVLVTVAVTAAGEHLHPTALLLALVGLAVAQVLVSLRHREIASRGRAADEPSLAHG